MDIIPITLDRARAIVSMFAAAYSEGQGLWDRHAEAVLADIARAYPQLTTEYPQLLWPRV